MVGKRQDGTDEFLEMIQEGSATRFAMEACGAVGVLQESASRVLVFCRFGFDNGALARDARRKLVAGGKRAVDWGDDGGRAAGSVLQQFVSLGGVWKGVLQSPFVELDFLFEVIEL